MKPLLSLWVCFFEKDVIAWGNKYPRYAAVYAVSSKCVSEDFLTVFFICISHSRYFTAIQYNRLWTIRMVKKVLNVNGITTDWLKIKHGKSACLFIKKLMSVDVLDHGLEDQHMEWKPAGQPEHASLNQCQLIVANRCSGHPQQVVEIRFLCNVIDAGALIGPCSHVTSCCCLIC